MQIVLFGDILIQGVTAEAAEADGGERLAVALRDRIGGADLSVANFETFVCPEGVEPINQWHSPPAAVDIVARAGLDVREGGAVEADWEPVVIDTEGVPGPGSDAEREEIRQAVEEVNQRLAGEDYSSFYCSSFAAQRWSGYLESWKRDVRTYGWKTLLAKPRRLRPHHFRLLWNLLRKRGEAPVGGDAVAFSPFRRGDVVALAVEPRPVWEFEAWNGIATAASS